MYTQQRKLLIFLFSGDNYTYNWWNIVITGNTVILGMMHNYSIKLCFWDRVYKFVGYCNFTTLWYFEFINIHIVTSYYIMYGFYFIHYQEPYLIYIDIILFIFLSIIYIYIFSCIYCNCLHNSINTIIPIDISSFWS